MAYVNRNQYNTMRNRAQQSDSRKKTADSEVKQEAAKLDQLRRESSGMSAADLQRMQRRFDDANRALQKELEDLRVELGLQLGRQAVETRRALDEIRRLAEGNKRDLEEVNRQIGALEKRIDREVRRLAQQMEGKRKQALCCCDRYGELVKRVQELFPEKYELLFPDVLQPGFYVLQTGLGYVLDNIEHGDYEAAIGVAQTRIPEATRMLGHLEFFHSAFLRARTEAEKTLSQVEDHVGQLAAEKKTVVTLENGVEYDDKHGAVYWVRELYEELRQKAEQSAETFREVADAHDGEGLTELTRELQALQAQLTVCETIEENERRLHYECLEQLSRIYEVLDQNDRGLWNLVGVYTDEDDLRKPVYMLLRRPEGYHLTVICTPERSTDPLRPGTVRCSWQAFDRGTERDDPAKCAVLWDNVTAILGQAGIRTMPEHGGAPDVADSASFAGRAVAAEVTARSKWLDMTRKTIGLHKKGEVAHG